MSQSDREKWDQRYREGAYATRKHPSALLVEWLPRLLIQPKPGSAIDLACGIGRNTLYLARQGWSVHAVDISDVALTRLAAEAEDLKIQCTRMDLETDQTWPATLAAAESFDLAIMFRYTNLPLIKRAAELLKPGGYLIAEAHMVTDDDVAGPHGTRFRVAPGELRDAAGNYDILHYQEGIVEDPDGRRVALARMLARKTPSNSAR